MAYVEEYVGSRSEFLRFMQEVWKSLNSGGINIEGKTLRLPKDTELEYKIKYDYDDEEYVLALKVSWPNPSWVEPEDVEEEEE
ncbi:MAG: hypothetical protein ACOX5W_06375 [Bacillota bacterium]|jgi:hypothetical protein